MSDKLILEDGKIVLTTEEGQQVKLPEKQLVEMLRRHVEPPIDGVALPDGLKFLRWRPPFLGAVHQLPAHVRQLRWIAADSSVPYGPGVKLSRRRISLPYAITFAIYYYRPPRLSLMGYNELYFRNEPLTSDRDRLGYPALLNVSKIKLPNRLRAWICTQHLKFRTTATWDRQLASLLEHTWNGGFNLSSEHHEGASWYGGSKGIHRDLHPIERWEQATQKDERFVLEVPWKVVPLKVGQLLDSMLIECEQAAGSRVFDRRTTSPKSPDIISLLLKSLKKVKTP